jgi:hypothetical protein
MRQSPGGGEAAGVIDTDCCGLRARLAQLLIHLMNQAALLQCSSNQFEFC